MLLELEHPITLTPAFWRSTPEPEWEPLPGMAVRGRYVGPDSFGTVVAIVDNKVLVLWTRPYTFRERSELEMTHAMNLQFQAEIDNEIYQDLMLSTNHP